MALDSKESDIEQLRGQLTTLSVHSLDATSISSSNDLDVSEGYPGTGVLPPSFPPPHAGLPSSFRFLCFLFFFETVVFLPLILYPLLPPPPLAPTALPGGPVGAVRITHSSTSESMSFTYQRTHKSVCIDTRPRLRSALFDSESEDEDEGDGRLERGRTPPALTYEQPPEAEPGGDPCMAAQSQDRGVNKRNSSFVNNQQKKA